VFTEVFLVQIRQKFREIRSEVCVQGKKKLENAFRNLKLGTKKEIRRKKRCGDGMRINPFQPAQQQFDISQIMLFFFVGKQIMCKTFCQCHVLDEINANCKYGLFCSFAFHFLFICLIQNYKWKARATSVD
jgi:hypothetical protein